MTKTLELTQTTNITPQVLAKSKKLFDLLDVSPATRDDYRHRIGLFTDFTKDKGLNTETFRLYKQYLADRNDLTIATKNKYLATAKVFLKELNRRGLIPVDITQNIKTFSQNKKHKREGLSDVEVKKLADYLRNNQNTRLKAIITLLALQGLRQIEVIRLDISDLELNRKVAFIQGKGKDDKEPIDLHPETTKALQDYLAEHKIRSGALFVSDSNNHKGKRLTTRALRGFVKDILRELDIDKTTHGFRHYFTTTLIKTYKGDLLMVAQYTRHKGLEMLQVYNDNIKKQADLPRYYHAFSGAGFAG